MPADRPVVTRFAPSPTGALHIGGARTALFAWAFAKKHGGRFILRIEDTDLKRSSPESTKGIVRDLAWLGLYSDEGPKYPCGKKGCDCGKASEDPGYDPYDRDRQLGKNGPYFQSQRAADGIYDKYIQLLLDSGKAYEDDGAVRFRMDKDVAFSDAVYGDISVKQEDLEDFIIRKGVDGGKMPTFHFAVVVDDALMEVTHVIRGQEHLTNTTKHAALYDALAEITGDAETWQRPVWVHTPSIMNPGGSKMSKRDKAKCSRKAAEDHVGGGGDRPAMISEVVRRYNSINLHLTLQAGTGTQITANDVEEYLRGEREDAGIRDCIARYLKIDLPEIEVDDFRKAGYLQSALLNFIALLGWNPGDDIEHFDLDFMCKSFSLERIGKSNSTFDRQKLLEFNRIAIAALVPEEFRGQLWSSFMSNTTFINSPLFKQSRSGIVGTCEHPNFVAFAKATQERAKTLADPLASNRFLFALDNAITYDFKPKPARKAMMGNEGQGITLLAAMCEAFAALPDDGFGAAAHEKMNELAAESGINMGKYAQPVRIAVSGGTVTPPIDVTLDLLGKDAVLARMGRCLEAAKAALAAAT